MNAGEEAALAPLQLARAGGEPAAQHEPFVLERAEGEVHVGYRHAERRRDRRRRRRPDNLEPAPHELPQGVLPHPAPLPLALGRRERRLAARAREHRREHRQALGRKPQSCARLKHAGPPGLDELPEIPLPLRIPHSAFRTREGTGDQQRIVQLVRGADVGPSFVLHPVDRRLVELAELVRRLHVEPAASDHGLGAALLQRGVVQERVRLRVQRLVRQGRRLRRVARDEREAPRLHLLEHALESREVHRLEQAVLDRLLHERMVGDLPVAHQVLRAGELIGKDRRDQVFGLHPLQRGGHLLPTALAQHGKCPGGVPAPA